MNLRGESNRVSSNIVAIESGDDVIVSADGGNVWLSMSPRLARELWLSLGCVLQSREVKPVYDQDAPETSLSEAVEDAAVAELRVDLEGR